MNILFIILYLLGATITIVWYRHDVGRMFILAYIGLFFVWWGVLPFMIGFFLADKIDWLSF